MFLIIKCPAQSQRKSIKKLLLIHWNFTYIPEVVIWLILSWARITVVLWVLKIWLKILFQHVCVFSTTKTSPNTDGQNKLILCFIPSYDWRTNRTLKKVENVILFVFVFYFCGSKTACEMPVLRPISDTCPSTPMALVLNQCH